MTERLWTMRSLEEMLTDNNLKDPEDIDALVELAEITDQLIRGEGYPEIGRLINYTIGHEYYEALTWVMAALQEEFDREDCRLKDFACLIGGSVANYDEFVKRLRVDLRAIANDMEPVLGPGGEVRSFFNILTYKTAYPSVFLVTEENFDTKDNDFIRYRLRFKNPGK